MMKEAARDKSSSTQVLVDTGSFANPGYQAELDDTVSTDFVLFMKLMKIFFRKMIM